MIKDGTNLTFKGLNCPTTWLIFQTGSKLNITHWHTCRPSYYELHQKGFGMFEFKKEICRLYNILQVDKLKEMDLLRHINISTLLLDKFV